MLLLVWINKWIYEHWYALATELYVYKLACNDLKELNLWKIKVHKDEHDILWIKWCTFKNKER